MKRSGTILLACVVAVIALPAVGAAAWPHERQGVMLGFNAGAGSAELQFENSDGTTVSGDREGGGAFGLRAGYAFNDRLALGLEGTGWSRTFENDSGLDATWTFTVSTIALTWYPGGGGFLLRGGLGWGRAEMELDLGDGTISGDDTGAAALIGLGYEWRLGRRFALGPAVDFGGMDLGEGWKANIANLTVGLTWYL